MKRGASLKRTPFKGRDADVRIPLSVEVCENSELAQFRKLPMRRGTYGPAVLFAAPKPVEHRRSRLLALAERMPCLLRIPGICNNDPSTTVACHSNWSEHGKAGARKADDQYSCWGCLACHEWLDRGSAPAATKKRAFMTGHATQVMFWRAIATDASTKQPDRDAVLWALALLNSTPVAPTENP